MSHGDTNELPIEAEQEYPCVFYCQCLEYRPAKSLQLCLHKMKGMMKNDSRTWTDLFSAEI